jgi:hypothetical protein
VIGLRVGVYPRDALAQGLLLEQAKTHDPPDSGSAGQSKRQGMPAWHFESASDRSIDRNTIIEASGLGTPETL